MLDIKIKSFFYPENLDNTILRDISLSLKQGEHLSVMGESGCGKSTLLHLIYGLLPLKDGIIHYKEKKLLGPLHHLIPGEPFMKLVSQDLDIMPYISVSENIASHLDRNNKTKDNARVAELLDVVQLTTFKNIKVQHLSGGQKQRVAIAKALAEEPEVLLLDEPFSSIDSFLKRALQRSIFNYTRAQKITCVIATHESEEAMSFTDKMLMLKDGRMVRLDSPKTIYNTIQDNYQGGFFGDVSIIDSSLLPCGKNANTLIKASKNYILLPHQLRVSKEKSLLKVEIINTYYKGGFYLIQAKYNGDDIYFNHNYALKKSSKHYITCKKYVF